MGWYRKNPIDVEAKGFDGTNWAELINFTGGYFREIGDTDDDTLVAEVFDFLHRTWIGVHAGDYIIRGSRGEFYPHEGELFKENYTEIPDYNDHDLLT